MKIIDLSHPIHPTMPVFPGSPAPRIDILSAINTAGFVERRLTFTTHTGTHVDAPAHMLKEAQDLSHLPLEYFYGRATMLPLMIQDTLTIALTDLKPHRSRLTKTEFVLLQTGWSKYWGQMSYFKQFPVLDADAARWLCDFGLKGIGVDTPSLDSSDSDEYPVHKALLGRNILLIENLTNLNQLPQDLFTLVCLPLPVQQADGSPVRAAAIID